MHPSFPLRAFSAVLACLVLPVSLGLAHPGHDHSDIPSVIRHPFASPEHIVVTVVVVGTLALAGFLLTRRARRRSRAVRR